MCVVRCISKIYLLSMQLVFCSHTQDSKLRRLPCCLPPGLREAGLFSKGGLRGGGLVQISVLAQDFIFRMKIRDFSYR